MTDYQKLISDLQEEMMTIPTSEKGRLKALNQQIMDLQRQYRESLGRPPARFGMEAVDIPHPHEIEEYEKETSQTVTSVTPPSPLANKIGGQNADKVLKMADDFLAETESNSTMDAINKAIDQYRRAEQDKADFKEAHEAILSEKSEKDKQVRESQRTLYGLLAKYAQSDVRIIELEGDKEGLVDLDIRNADVLPTGTGFSIKYELVANELNLLKWCLQWNPTLLQVDLKKAEAYIKQLRVWSLGKRTSDWYLPLEMPPAEIVAKILPTIGDVFDDNEESEDDE